MGGGAQSPDFPASFASRKAAGWKTPSREIDDSELAGDGLIEDRIDAGDPRVVFGQVPSMKEANEAASELKDALEMVCPPSSGSVCLLSSQQETKACITGEFSVSRGAMQAFRLLKERPDIQTIVTSIVCDPKVFKAMMQNPELKKLLETKKGAQFKPQEFQKSSAGSCHVEMAEKPSEGFMGFMKGIKLTMQKKVQSLSNFAQSFFPQANEEENYENSDGPFKNIFTASALMGLVMMVITIVVLKRH